MGRRDRSPRWQSAAGPDASTLGVWSLAALGFLVGSGVPLAFAYEPDPVAAHGAVARLADGAWGAVRGAHAWAASAVVALVLVHVARGYVDARFAVVGRLRALAGLAAFAALLAAYQLGSILPWDQQAWEAYQHIGSAGEAIGVGSVPEDPAAARLERVFWLHVLLVPVLLVLALLWHVGGVAAPGRSLRRLGALVRERWRSVMVLVGVVLAAGVLWPPELGPAPVARLVVSAPDWPFLWLVPLQDRFGALALWLLPAAFGAAAWFLWRPMPHGHRARLVVLAATAAVFLGLSFVGAW